MALLSRTCVLITVACSLSSVKALATAPSWFARNMIPSSQAADVMRKMQDQEVKPMIVLDANNIRGAVNFRISKEKLASLGVDAVLTYGVVSNVNAACLVSFAWFSFSKAAGLEPTAPITVGLDLCVWDKAHLSLRRLQAATRRRRRRLSSEARSRARLRCDRGAVRGKSPKLPLTVS